MADTVNKQKLQLRSGASFNDKTLPPATKLLLNHGKPNFTIQRSPKAQQNGEGNPLSPKPQNGLSSSSSSSNNNNDNAFRNANGNTNGTATNNNDLVVKSTKFNGVFRPANLPLSEMQTHQQTAAENEAAKVVLRRVNAPPSPTTAMPGEDASVPEFIRKQRRIQERLAKDNILDFESRRSGYFTQVMISPSSPNRTSFVETMSSPAIVPSLEMPPPARKEETVLEQQEPEEPIVPVAAVSVVSAVVAAVVVNGDINGLAEEEEVAKAIEEVNKAVAGEDDDKTPEVEVEDLMAAAVKTVEEAVTTAAMTVEESVLVPEEETKAPEEQAAIKEEVVHAAVAVTSLLVEQEAPQQNGHASNGTDAVTISHTNGMDGPSVPAPDPSGALGVNYEPKTIVSFSKDLGSEPNKYPDTVKLTMEGESTPTVNSDLQELAKLKFEIKTDGDDDVLVTPVLRTD